MSFYFNTLTEEAGFQGDLQILGWEEGLPLPENWVQVSYGEQPILNDNQYFLLDKPQIIDGEWIANFTVYTLTEEQMAKMQEALSADVTAP
jgi:hypothetical protein